MEKLINLVKLYLKNKTNTNSLIKLDDNNNNSILDNFIKIIKSENNKEKISIFNTFKTLINLNCIESDNEFNNALVNIQNNNYVLFIVVLLLYLDIGKEFKHNILSYIKEYKYSSLLIIIISKDILEFIKLNKSNEYSINKLYCLIYTFILYYTAKEVNNVNLLKNKTEFIDELVNNFYIFIEDCQVDVFAISCNLFEYYLKEEKIYDDCLMQYFKQLNYFITCNYKYMKNSNNFIDKLFSYITENTFTNLLIKSFNNSYDNCYNTSSITNTYKNNNNNKLIKSNLNKGNDSEDTDNDDNDHDINTKKNDLLKDNNVKNEYNYNLISEIDANSLFLQILTCYFKLIIIYQSSNNNEVIIINNIYKQANFVLSIYKTQPKLMFLALKALLISIEFNYSTSSNNNNLISFNYKLLKQLLVFKFTAIAYFANNFLMYAPNSLNTNPIIFSCINVIINNNSIITDENNHVNNIENNAINEAMINCNEDNNNNNNNNNNNRFTFSDTVSMTSSMFSLVEKSEKNKNIVGYNNFDLNKYNNSNNNSIKSSNNSNSKNPLNVKSNSSNFTAKETTNDIFKSLSFGEFVVLFNNYAQINTVTITSQVNEVILLILDRLITIKTHYSYILEDSTSDVNEEFAYFGRNFLDRLFLSTCNKMQIDKSQYNIIEDNSVVLIDNLFKISNLFEKEINIYEKIISSITNVSNDNKNNNNLNESKNLAKSNSNFSTTLNDLKNQFRIYLNTKYYQYELFDMFHNNLRKAYNSTCDMFPFKIKESDLIKHFDHNKMETSSLFSNLFKLLFNLGFERKTTSLISEYVKMYIDSYLKQTEKYNNLIDLISDNFFNYLLKIEIKNLKFLSNILSSMLKQNQILYIMLLQRYDKHYLKAFNNNYCTDNSSDKNNTFNKSYSLNYSHYYLVFFYLLKPFKSYKNYFKFNKDSIILYKWNFENNKNINTFNLKDSSNLLNININISISINLINNIFVSNNWELILAALEFIAHLNNYRQMFNSILTLLEYNVKTSLIEYKSTLLADINNYFEGYFNDIIKDLKQLDCSEESKIKINEHKSNIKQFLIFMENNTFIRPSETIIPYLEIFNKFILFFVGNELIDDFYNRKASSNKNINKLQLNIDFINSLKSKPNKNNKLSSKELSIEFVKDVYELFNIYLFNKEYMLILISFLKESWFYVRLYAYSILSHIEFKKLLNYKSTSSDSLCNILEEEAFEYLFSYRQMEIEGSINVYMLLNYHNLNFISKAKNSQILTSLNNKLKNKYNEYLFINDNNIDCINMFSDNSKTYSYFVILHYFNNVIQNNIDKYLERTQDNILYSSNNFSLHFSFVALKQSLEELFNNIKLINSFNLNLNEINFIVNIANKIIEINKKFTFILINNGVSQLKYNVEDYNNNELDFSNSEDKRLISIWISAKYSLLSLCFCYDILIMGNAKFLDLNISNANKEISFNYYDKIYNMFNNIINLMQEYKHMGSIMLLNDSLEKVCKILNKSENTAYKCLCKDYLINFISKELIKKDLCSILRRSAGIPFILCTVLKSYNIDDKHKIYNLPKINIILSQTVNILINNFKTNLGSKNNINKTETSVHSLNILKTLVDDSSLKNIFINSNLYEHIFVQLLEELNNSENDWSIKNSLMLMFSKIIKASFDNLSYSSNNVSINSKEGTTFYTFFQNKPKLLKLIIIKLNEIVESIYKPKIHNFDNNIECDNKENKDYNKITCNNDIDKNVNYDDLIMLIVTLFSKMHPSRPIEINNMPEIETVCINLFDLIKYKSKSEIYYSLLSISIEKILGCKFYLNTSNNICSKSNKYNYDNYFSVIASDSSYNMSSNIPGLENKSSNNFDLKQKHSNAELNLLPNKTTEMQKKLKTFLSVNTLDYTEDITSISFDKLIDENKSICVISTNSSSKQKVELNNNNNEIAFADKTTINVYFNLLDNLVKNIEYNNTFSELKANTHKFNNVNNLNEFLAIVFDIIEFIITKIKKFIDNELSNENNKNYLKSNKLTNKISYIEVIAKSNQSKLLYLIYRLTNILIYICDYKINILNKKFPLAINHKNLFIRLVNIMLSFNEVSNNEGIRNLNIEYILEANKTYSKVPFYSKCISNLVNIWFNMNRETVIEIKFTEKAIDCNNNLPNNTKYNIIIKDIFKKKTSHEIVYFILDKFSERVAVDSYEIAKLILNKQLFEYFSLDIISCIISSIKLTKNHDLNKELIKSLLIMLKNSTYKREFNNNNYILSPQLIKTIIYNIINVVNYFWIFDSKLNKKCNLDKEYYYQILLISDIITEFIGPNNEEYIRISMVYSFEKLLCTLNSDVFYCINISINNNTNNQNKFMREIEDKEVFDIKIKLINNINYMFIIILNDENPDIRNISCDIINKFYNNYIKNSSLNINNNNSVSNFINSFDYSLKLVIEYITINSNSFKELINKLLNENPYIANLKYILDNKDKVFYKEPDNRFIDLINIKVNIINGIMKFNSKMLDSIIKQKDDTFNNIDLDSDIQINNFSQYEIIIWFISNNYHKFKYLNIDIGEHYNINNQIFTFKEIRKQLLNKYINL